MKPKGYRRILPLSERQGLKSRIEDPRINAAVMDSVEGGFVHAPPAHYMNPLQADADTKRLKRILEEGSPQDDTENRRARSQRDREIAKLEDIVRPHMIPRKTFQMKRTDSSEYNKSVDHQVKVNANSEITEAKMRLQSLRRGRDPDNPKAGSLEYLRKDRRIKA